MLPAEPTKGLWKPLRDPLGAHDTVTLHTRRSFLKGDKGNEGLKLTARIQPGLSRSLGMLADDGGNLQSCQGFRGPSAKKERFYESARLCLRRAMNTRTPKVGNATAVVMTFLGCSQMWGRIVPPSDLAMVPKFC